MSLMLQVPVLTEPVEYLINMAAGWAAVATTEANTSAVDYGEDWTLPLSYEVFLYVSLHVWNSLTTFWY